MRLIPILVLTSTLALAACDRGGSEGDVANGEDASGATAAVAFTGTPDAFEGIWAADCERPFVRLENRAIHVYPDGQTYDLTRAEVQGDNLIVAYQSGNGAIEETYAVGDGTLQLVSGVYDGATVPWDKLPMERCE